jgi:hypothetical protein
MHHNLPGEAAAQLGAKGGKTTAKRMIWKDPDYLKQPEFQLPGAKAVNRYRSNPADIFCQPGYCAN